MADCYIMRQGGTEQSYDLSVAIDEKRKTDHCDLTYKILPNGSCGDDSEYRIDCYNISSYSQIYIKINDPECVFNFQTHYNVSYAYPNPELVGSPVVSGESGFYNVPAGATWVCFGVKNSDTVTGAYNFHIDGLPIVNT